MTLLIFLIIDIEILDILTYISSYFITSELYIRPSNTNTRNNDTIQNNNNNNNNDNSHDDDDDDDHNNNNNNNNNNNIPETRKYCVDVQWGIVSHASGYEKQGHATIACLVTKFRGYRRVRSCMPPTK